MTRLSTALDQTDSAALFRNISNSSVSGGMNFGNPCNQSAVYGYCDEHTGLDAGSIIAFTLLCTLIVVGWFLKSCCFCCLEEKNNVNPNGQLQGYDTESESLSDGSSFDPCDETVSVEEETSEDDNLPRV